MVLATDSHQALAQQLKKLRLGSGMSLQELANQSGVSRATLSRIENAEVSPTAESLGRLASALKLPLSQLFAPLEPGFEALVRRDDQSVWGDPSAGFDRRSISPPSARLRLEMIECRIEPHKTIRYDRPAFPGHEHHLFLLEGELFLEVDNARYEMRSGDCIRYQLNGASAFWTGKDHARYIIAMA